MSDQEQEREQAEEPQEDMELPDEQSEDVKGGMLKKAPGADAGKWEGG
jgi:hypothetical protein